MLNIHQQLVHLHTPNSCAERRLDFILDMVKILRYYWSKTESGRSVFSVLNTHQIHLHLHTHTFVPICSMMLDFILDMVNILTTESGRSLFSVLNIHQELLHFHTAPTSCAEVLIDAGFQTRYGPHVLEDLFDAQPGFICIVALIVKCIGKECSKGYHFNANQKILKDLNK